jgi:RNA polymerase sigma-70 factor (ECF subfamily)
MTGNLALNSNPIEEPCESDASLVAAAVAGDHQAMHTLFERHAPMMNRLARRLLGPGLDANDLVQDAFVEALMGIARLKNGQAFQSWICSIVVRTAQKVHRRRRILGKLGLLPQQRSDQRLDMDGFCSRNAPPDVVVELRAIYDLLNKLPAEVHVALILRRVEGLGVEEIAEQMGLSVSTVKRRLATAEGRLGVWSNVAEGLA